MQCLEVSGAVRLLYASLGVKGLNSVSREVFLRKIKSNSVTKSHIMRRRKFFLRKIKSKSHIMRRRKFFQRKIKTK